MSPARRAVRIGTVCGLLAALIWGLLQASGRVAVLQGLNPFDLAALRFGVAGLILSPWLFVNSNSLLDFAGVGWRKATILMVLLGPPFFLINMGGYVFAPLAHGLVILPATFIIAGLCGGAYFFGDRITASRALGAALVVAGLAITSGMGLAYAGSTAALGDAMFAAAGLMWCAAAILMKRWKLSPFQTTASVGVLSAILYLPAYGILGTPEQLATAPISAIMFHVVSSGVLAGVVAMLAFARSVEILGPGKAAIFPALVPAMGALVGFPLTGEMPGLAQLIGLVLVSLGLIVAVAPSTRG